MFSVGTKKDQMQMLPILRCVWGSTGVGYANYCPAAAIVTGSEDGTLRRMTLVLQQPLQTLIDSQQIGEHPAGSAVKALAYVSWGPSMSSICSHSLSKYLQPGRAAVLESCC